MSSLEVPTTYRSNTSNTVHIETDNPELLSLVGVKESLQVPSSATSVRQSHHSDADLQPKKTVQLVSGPPVIHTPESVSEDRKAAQNFYNNDHTKASQGRTDNSSAPPIQTDSSRSEPAHITECDSEIAAPVARTHSEEAAVDDRGDPRNTHNDREIPVIVNNNQSDQLSTEKEAASYHPFSAPGVSYAATAVPANGRASVTSYVHPSLRTGSAASSFNSHSPEYHRVDVPYSSRRLKAQPVSDKSVVSIALIDEHGARTALNGTENHSVNPPQPATYRVAEGRRSLAEPPQIPVNTSSNSGLSTVSEPGLSAHKPLKAHYPSSQRNDSKHTENKVIERSTELPVAEKGVSRTLPHSLEFQQIDKSGKDLSAKLADIRQPRHNTNHIPQDQPFTDNGNRGINQGTVGANTAVHGPTLQSVKKTDRSSLNPSVERVYVDSPSFTQEEEEQYRFVSSRIDDEDRDSYERHPTYRGMDQQAVNTMDSRATLRNSNQATRKPFKQVRYQDEEDRFEDREDFVRNNRAAEQPRSRPHQAQYQADPAEAVDIQPPQRVRSLTLPSGPTYDPEDEEDLKRETTYQQELRNRVETIQRTAEDTVIPHAPLVDALDDNGEYYNPLVGSEVIGPDIERRHQHRDSLDIYDKRVHQNMLHSDWRNPHRQDYTDDYGGYADQGRESYADPERRGYGGQQMGYAEPGNGEGYNDYYYAQQQADLNNSSLPMRKHDYTGDVYHEQYSSALNPPPPVQDSPGYSKLSQQGYAEPRDGFYVTEPRGYSQRPVPGYSQDFGDYGNQTHYSQQPAVDGYQHQREEETKRPSPRLHPGLLTLPHKPDYDYVSHNKTDYGFSQKRTYKKIHEVKKEEEEKLTHVFIHPKVKPKAKKGSRDNSPSRPLAITYNPEDLTARGAEELWAQRSAFLAQAHNSKVGGTHRNSGAIPRFGQSVQPSSTSGNQMQLVSPPQQLAQISPAQSPPYHYSGEPLPGITQHLVTEDGQRISVDVNLRLVSPPVGSEVDEYGQQPMGNQRHTGMQYPMVESRNPGGYARSNSHDYTDTGYTTNPFKKIPPIGTGSEGSPNSAQKHSDGSYMLSYLKEKEKQIAADKPWYRVYGIKDYKRMQKEMQLGYGTLGPDLDTDTYKEKREKMLRKMDYAKAVTEKNSKELMSKKPPAFPREKEQDDILSKRKLAVEYAKHIPKPTVKPKANVHNNYELASKSSPISKPAKTQGAGQKKPSVEVLDIGKLHDRHQQDKRSSEIIQQKARGVVS